MKMNLEINQYCIYIKLILQAVNNRPERVTPYYVYHPEELERNIDEFKVLEDSRIQIMYAVKANNHKPLIERMVKEGYGFDVASKEELLFVNSLGADISKISFSSPTKLEEDLKIASKLGVLNYAFDSEQEIEKIMKYVERPRLFARMSVYNDESMHELSGIFGMSKEYFGYIMEQASKNDWSVEGISFHVGSQNLSISSWEKALKYMKELIDVAKDFDISISSLNIGGGIPVAYDNSAEPLGYYIKGIVKQLDQFKSDTGIKNMIIEPGRAMCANTMSVFTKIINIKDYKNPPIVVTELSVYHGFIEPLEKLEYPVHHYESYLNPGIKKEQKIFKVSGISCAGTDIIKNQCSLPVDVKIGDLLVIPLAGAYTFVFEKFQMKDFPEIYNE
jgi:ornithine decarboxylase